MLPKDFVELKEWDEASIGERGKALAELAVSVWPMPAK
jgi:hypothetical protein